jgi:putative aldouronate transport system permease protein
MRARRFPLFDVLNYLLLGLFVLSILYPFWDMLIRSLSTPINAMKLGFYLFPKVSDLTLSSYKIVFLGGQIVWGYVNTIFRAVVGTVLMVIVTMAAAYPLSKKHLPYRRGITIFMVVTMFFSGGMIPSYLLIKWLGLIDSRWALVLPAVAQVFNILLVRNYIMAVVDRSLEESAEMDGANAFTILGRIITPLCKPAIATIGLWSIVGHWNAWFDAMLYINSETKQVLQLLLRKIMIENAQGPMQKYQDMAMGMAKKQYAPDSLKAAFLYLTILPILLVYPFLQKYFIRGIMLGAIKG